MIASRQRLAFSAGMVAIAALMLPAAVQADHYESDDNARACRACRSA